MSSENSGGGLANLPPPTNFKERVIRIFKIAGIVFYAFFVSHQFVTRMCAMWSYGVFYASSLSLIIPQTESKMDEYWSKPNYNLSQPGISEYNIVETGYSYASNITNNVPFDTELEASNFMEKLPDRVYLPALSVGHLVGGVLVDLHGARRPMYMSLTVTGITCLLIGLLDDMKVIMNSVTLIILFTLSGIFSGAILPATVKIIGTWLMVNIRNPRKWVGLNMSVIAMTNRIGAFIHMTLIYPTTKFSFEIVYIVAGCLCILMGPLTYLGIVSSPKKLKVTCREYPQDRHAKLKMYTARPTLRQLLPSITDHRLIIYGTAVLFISIIRYRTLYNLGDWYCLVSIITSMFLCIITDWFGRSIPALIYIICSFGFIIPMFFMFSKFLDALLGAAMVSVYIMLVTTVPVDISLDKQERNVGLLTGIMTGLAMAGNAIGAAVAIDTMEGVDATININKRYAELAVWIGALIVAFIALSFRARADLEYAKKWRKVKLLNTVDTNASSINCVDDDQYDVRF